MKLWGGRFRKETASDVEAFTESISIDYALASHDIEGSIAHAKMLTHCGLLNDEELKTIVAGLQRLQQKIQNNEVQFSIHDEDIHMNIERLLHAEIGQVAGKLHTARSRNDQVALDLHLYCREQIVLIINALLFLQESLIEKAAKNIYTVMPGYTHLQQAQPISFAHHLLAYVSMFQRDIERCIHLWHEVNIMPLGAGALAGTSLPIDKNITAQLLKFDAIYTNSMDAVSNRDFIIMLLSQASLIMMHLSRFCEELVLWSSHEFSFIELDDAFCTGSSMMPQKKNPDIAELIRGKTGRVYGGLISILTIMKSLPLSYNRDMQEDKQALFDVVTTMHQVLNIFPQIVRTLSVNKAKMLEATNNNFLCATALSDYLVTKGMPFRQSHEVIGNVVKFCLENKLKFSELNLSSFQQFSALFAQDLYQYLDPTFILHLKKDQGGSGFESVQYQLTMAQEKIKQANNWLLTQVNVKQEKDCSPAFI